MSAATRPLDSQSLPAFGSFEWIQRAAGFVPTPEPKLSWAWSDDEREDEEHDERNCAAPACGVEDAALVYDGGDHRIYACSRPCATAIEHSARVRNDRWWARRRHTSTLHWREAQVWEALARACEIARRGERTPAGQIVLREWLSPTLDGAIQQVNVARSDRERARTEIASGAQCPAGKFANAVMPYRYATRCTRTVGHRGACRIERVKQ